MIHRNDFKLATLFALPLLALAVGCAAPTASEDGQTAEDLSASNALNGIVTPPLCLEHRLHAEVCVYDYEWRARAATVCANEGRRVEGFEIERACGIPTTNSGPTPTTNSGTTPTPSSGSAPTSSSGAGSNAGSAAGSNAAGDPSTDPVHTPQPTATRVSFACCDIGIEPPVRPRPASETSSAATAF